MIGRTNTGGGAGFNFKVIGGTTAPNNPKENMIWVNTENQKIDNWIFSGTEPENPVPDMVWISTGLSSVAEFNALKKCAIQVYPAKVRQYVNGKFVAVVAKIFLSGEWQLFSTTSYDIVVNGVEMVETTMYGSGMQPTKTHADGYVSYKSPSSGFYSVAVLCDISEFERVVVKGNLVEYTGFASLCLWDASQASPTINNAIAKIDTRSTSDAILEIGTYTGMHKVGLSWITAKEYKVTDWYLE